MPASPMESKAIANIEQLSEVIIETLKEMSGDRKPLSVVNLCECLSQKRRIVDLVAGLKPVPSFAQTGTAADSASDEPATVKVVELKAKTKEAQKQAAASLKQMETLKEQVAEERSFYKRALLTLSGLTSGGNNTDLQEAVDAFKARLMSESDITQLEQSLSVLKNVVFQAEFDPAKSSPGGGREGGLLGRWLKRKNSSAEDAVPSESSLKNIQSAYLNILLEFHMNFGREYVDRFTSIQERIRESQNMDELLSHNEEIISFIRTYMRLMGEERNQVTDIIAEIGNGLLEMENQFVRSMDHTSRSYESGDHFNRMLEGQMEEIKNSAQISKSLTEFKGFVVSTLSSIKSAMEDKRREDSQRLEEAREEMGTLRQNLSGMQKEILQVQERSKVLEQESITDSLTGIPNRRALNLRMREELQRFQRYGQFFSILVYDIDHFKKVNDTYGHWAGDKCLKEIVKRIQPSLRESDFMARYGGEEFVILMPGIDRDSALAAAQRLCLTIERTRFTYRKQSIPLTISIGVSRVESEDQDQESIFTRADKALYQAKNSGRNRAVLI